VAKVKIPAVKMFAEFTAALQQNKKAEAAFAAFNPRCKREYLAWIADANRPETTGKRLATAIEWISEGKHRHWKYQNFSTRLRRHSSCSCSHLVPDPDRAKQQFLLWPNCLVTVRLQSKVQPPGTQSPGNMSHPDGDRSVPAWATIPRACYLQEPAWLDHSSWMV
jgi:hypothetical protein